MTEKQRSSGLSGQVWCGGRVKARRCCVTGSYLNLSVLTESLASCLVKRVRYDDESLVSSVSSYRDVL